MCRTTALDLCFYLDMYRQSMRPNQPFIQVKPFAGSGQINTSHALYQGFLKNILVVITQQIPASQFCVEKVNTRSGCKSKDLHPLRQSIFIIHRTCDTHLIHWHCSPSRSGLPSQTIANRYFKPGFFARAGSNEAWFPLPFSCADMLMLNKAH